MGLICQRSPAWLSPTAVMPPVMAMPPMVMPPMMMPAMPVAMVVPADFGRHLIPDLIPGSLLHRRCRSGIDQGRRRRASDRSRRDKKRTSRRKSQNSRPVHSVLLRIM
jgi:hypothetical protein